MCKINGSQSLKSREQSSNNDQYEISPCNINVCSTPKVMRIKDMIR